MKAARLARRSEFELVEAGVPALAPTEVLIEVEACGVCGSNLPPWMGDVALPLPLEPGAPGHEAFGRIVARGDAVRELEVGRLVTALTYRSFAELDVAQAETVVPIPDDLAGRPVLGEPLACAMNVWERASIQHGDAVVVVGVGFLGALLLQLARLSAPEFLAAVSRRAAGRKLALAMGADAALSPEEAESALGERPAGVAIEVTGHQAPLDLASRLVGVRGRLVVAGYHQTGRREVDMQLWNWKGIDVVNAHERDPAVYRRGMERGLRLLKQGAVALDPLITHSFPLSAINEAFRVASEMPDGFVKAIVCGGRA